jgi:hypothetical protein
MPLAARLLAASLLSLAACTTVIIEDPDSTASTAEPYVGDCHSGCAPGYICQVYDAACNDVLACVPVPAGCAATPDCACLAGLDPSLVGCAEDAPGHANAFAFAQCE